MDKLLTDRVSLIRGLQASIEKMPTASEKAHVQAIIKIVRDDKEQHFLSFSQEQPNKVSYARRPEFRNNVVARTRATLGRYIRKNLGVGDADISEASLHTLATSCFVSMAKESLDNRMKFLTGDEITDAYYDSLAWCSCMTGPECSPYVEMYALNSPEKV